MNPAHAPTVFRCEPPPAGWPPRFGIVTAWNPHDQPTDPASNADADRALLGRLEAEGWSHFRVTGCSPDGTHAEPGFAVAASSPDDVVELGRWFAQAAVYWIEDDRLYLVDCRMPEPVPVGRWSDRLLPDGTDPR